MGGGGCVLSRCAPCLFKRGALGYGVANRLEEGKSEDEDASEEAVAGAQARVRAAADW